MKIIFICQSAFYGCAFKINNNKEIIKKVREIRPFNHLITFVFVRIWVIDKNIIYN